MGIELEPIGGGNVEAVAHLLQERNQTIAAYTRWKYSSLAAHGFRGVLARNDGAPVGCLGVVPRKLKLSDGQVVKCGWFADWFVSPRMRGGGIGTSMLELITRELELVCGHPGPLKARNLCLANGYEPLVFHSRRRLVLRRLAYERWRTRYAPIALSRCLRGVWRSFLEKRSAQRGIQPGAPVVGPAFAEAELFGQWIMNQPVRADVRRGFCRWQGNSLEVWYAEDTFAKGERRRRVLFSSGEGNEQSEPWRDFASDAVGSGCTHVEVFTSNPAVDQAWARLGACRYPDAPVLVAWKSVRPQPLLLHGWDRENWTYAAGQGAN